MVETIQVCAEVERDSKAREGSKIDELHEQFTYQDTLTGVLLQSGHSVYQCLYMFASAWFWIVFTSEMGFIDNRRYPPIQ